MTCPPGAATPARGGRFPVPAYLLLITAFLAAWAWPVADPRADDVFEFYPSYYPHEIRIEAVGRASAAKLLSNTSLHAYIGGDPFTGGTPPAGLGRVESLGSYLVVTFNRASQAVRDADGRCAAAAALVGALAATKEAYVFHPYPVTPFHADYLHHFDLAESARKQPDPRPASTAPPRALKIRAKGKAAEQLVPREHPEERAGVEQVAAAHDPSKSRSTASGSGALKSCAMRTRARSAPSARSTGRSR